MVKISVRCVFFFFFNNNLKKINNQENNLNRLFTKYDIQMANNHKKLLLNMTERERKRSHSVVSYSLRPHEL